MHSYNPAFKKIQKVQHFWHTWFKQLFRLELFENAHLAAPQTLIPFIFALWELQFVYLYNFNLLHIS